MKEYKYSDALIHSNLRQMAQQKNLPPTATANTPTALMAPHSLCFEGSFETEPNHQAQLFLILGNGLLLCRWNPAKIHRLKFVAFYPWSSFFSVSNRPGNKLLIATFKLANDSKHKSSSKLSPSASTSTRSATSSSMRRAFQSQRELRLPLKSANLADKIARKLSQHIRASQRQ